MSFYHSTCRNLALLVPAVLAMVISASADECGSWEVLDTPHPPASHAIIRDIAANAPDDVWAVGTYVAGSTEAMSMRFDGSSWNLIPVPLVDQTGNSGLLAVASSDGGGAGNIWAAGFREYTPPIPWAFFGMHIFVVRWDGSQWQVMDTPHLGSGSGDRILGIEVVAPNDVWFVGEGHPVPNQPQPALAMRWNGSDFQVIPVPQVNDQVPGFGNGNGLRAISALGPNEIWAVGAAGDGDALSCQKSQIHRWNGSQWQHIPAPAMNCWWHSLDAVVAIAPDDVWAGGECQDANGFHGLALHYNGTGWTQVPVPAGISSFVAFASDDIYAGGGPVMHWDGASWTIVETFPEVAGATTNIDAPPGGTACDLFAGGRQYIGNSILPFSARRTHGGTEPKPGDLNGDGTVGVADLLILLANWGPCADCAAPGDCPADLDGDCAVGVPDLLILLANWG